MACLADCLAVLPGGSSGAAEAKDPPFFQLQAFGLREAWVGGLWPGVGAALRAFSLPPPHTHLVLPPPFSFVSSSFPLPFSAVWGLGGEIKFHLAVLALGGLGLPACLGL